MFFPKCKKSCQNSLLLHQGSTELIPVFAMSQAQYVQAGSPLCPLQSLFFQKTQPNPTLSGRPSLTTPAKISVNMALFSASCIGHLAFTTHTMK